MSDIIKLLPDSVANQIAAGEVIQRPSSVIKELVENSVDAGATEIRIFIKDAGRTLIQVVDNGKGMTETDARMAFERHATSKIQKANDLFSLHTMGFRGEALPSICAISQIEMRTKTSENTLGTRLLINATRVESQEPVSCETGTNIMVKNLFFNVPARRKFLKSDNVELSNIMREFERLALVNNHIRMSIETGFKTIDLRAASFHQRIAEIWKNALDLHLIPVEVDTSLIKISGFISRPEYARRRNPLQYLIVNGRNMRHPYFHKAIVGCYDSLIASDTQPCYFLKFEVNPETIDVNIHPTKNEIKFEYEQEIWPILQASVKAALGKSGSVPSIDFSIETLPVSNLKPGEKPQRPELEMPKNYNPFEGTQYSQLSYQNYSYKPKKEEKIEKNWDLLYSDFLNSPGIHENNKNLEGESMQLDGFQDVEPGRICLQYKDRYIITCSHDGVIIIDQRRAHIRILYDDFLNHLQEGDQISQGLMFPDTLTIPYELQNTLQEVMPELYKAGFRLEYESEDKWMITGVPSFAKNMDARDIVMKMIEGIDDSDSNYGRTSKDITEIVERMALIMARGSAINYGQKLNSEEMEHIVGSLFSLPDSSFTPNGNKIYYIVEDSKLLSIFR